MRLVVGLILVMMSSNIFARTLGAVEESCDYLKSLQYELGGRTTGAIKWSSLCMSFLLSQRNVRNEACETAIRELDSTDEAIKLNARSMPGDIEALGDSFLRWITNHKDWREKTIKDTALSQDIFSEFPCKEKFPQDSPSFSKKSKSEESQSLTREEELQRLRREEELQPVRQEAGEAHKKVDQFLTEIRDKIKHHFAWAGDKQDLTVAYRVSLSGNGEILNLRIMEPSGDSSFDKAVAQAIYLSQPLPVPKDEADFLKNFDPLLIRFSF